MVTTTVKLYIIVEAVTLVAFEAQNGLQNWAWKDIMLNCLLCCLMTSYGFLAITSTSNLTHSESHYLTLFTLEPLCKISSMYHTVV